MKAKAQPFWLDRVAVSYTPSGMATIRGHMPIARSRRGHTRPIYARLTLEQLTDLGFQIAKTTLAITMENRTREKGSDDERTTT